MENRDRKKNNGLLPAEETGMFCAQTALVLKSGISLPDGMEALRESADVGGKSYFDGICEEVNESGSLARAVEKAGIFPSYMVQMTEIGEKSGKLDDVMESLGLYYEREAKIRRAIRNAVLYPAVLLMMMAVVIAVITIKVLPVFSRVFESLQSGSAASGMMQFGTVAGWCALGLVLLFLILLAALVIFSRLKGKNGQMERFYSVFLPTRRVNGMIASARFASMLSMMLSSGYNLEDALALAPGILPDAVSREKVAQLVQLMDQGESFPEALIKAKLFSGLYSRMIRVGFQAGQMDTVMRKLADIYEEEADDAINRAVSVIEPIMVAVLAIIIGVILLSVMLPLVSIMSSIG